MADIFSSFGGGMFSMEILLPFFLVLAIVYGALEVSKVFSNKGVKAIIAVVFAFFAIMNSQVVTFINSILPYAAMIFVVIFIAWILLKPLRGENKDGKKKDPVLIIVILVLVMVLLARMQATDYLPENSILSNTNLIWVVGILVIGVILWKIYKMSQNEGGGHP
ncbi:MAG: hypothetical protein NTU57_00250 [Candidatus Aenigmarchaeota archaeon]|nr:hypothetical protein [Candidatus Aenigmarchaeota archaeon]